MKFSFKEWLQGGVCAPLPHKHWKPNEAQKTYLRKHKVETFYVIHHANGSASSLDLCGKSLKELVLMIENDEIETARRSVFYARKGMEKMVRDAVREEDEKRKGIK